VIKVLAVGDVMGRPGRLALLKGLEQAREEFAPDFVIMNGENVAGGFGITKKIFEELIGSYGIDCITMGNHWMDKKDIYEFRDHPKIVLPANMFNVDEPSKGLRLLETAGGVRIAVMNVIGKVFMKGENSSPYDMADRMLDLVPSYCKVRILDIHAEATSEKQGLAHHLTGRVSAVYGTHSHVPTLDARIFKNHTGFVTDLGMTGPYDSVIGMDSTAAVRRMRTGERKNFEPAKSDLWFYAMLFEINEQTGACCDVHRLRFSIKDS
jgi:2',3'-cyclic-nucleotide 2'-phosphodiesterase